MRILENNKLRFHRAVQVDVLRKDVAPPAWKVQHYYEMDSGKNYETAMKPYPVDRLVFLLQGTSNHVIIPNNGKFTFEDE